MTDLTRLHTITEKIERADTGLAGALFVHVVFDNDNRVHSLRLSYKGKDGSALDRTFSAIADKATKICQQELGA